MPWPSRPTTTLPHELAREYLAARKALRTIRRSNTPGQIRRARLRVIDAARAADAWRQGAGR